LRAGARANSTSGLGDDTPLRERGRDGRASDLCAPPRLLLTDDDHVNGNIESRQDAPQMMVSMKRVYQPASCPDQVCPSPKATRGSPGNLDALWHDLECGGYREDLALWRTLARQAGGPVLDVGAGTGRVTLELAAMGLEVVALDVDVPLLEALEHRARRLPVQTVVGDARELALGRRFSLVLVPMQTLQLLGGRRGRAAFLRGAREHLEPGGLLAAALADAVECFDDEHELPPPPDARDIVDVRYASQLLAVVDEGQRAAIHRRREIIGPAER
jgi:SAM-dependent methyltransferase